MYSLTETPPSSVEVAGTDVPLCDGFRTGIKAHGILAGGGHDAPLALLYLLFGAVADDGMLALPEAVAAHPREAVEAGAAWVEGAFGAMGYGSGRGGGSDRQGRARFDFSADAAIVAADFQRLYGIDLADPSTQVHWYRFVALLLAAMRTEGSLTGAAMAAREPIPAKAKGAERERLKRLQRAWALPLTDDERLRLALERF